MGPKISVEKTDNFAAFKQRVQQITRMAAWVGIPEADSRMRKQTLQTMAGAVTGQGKKSIAKRSRIAASAAQDVTNAQLLFIHSKGSRLRGIPPRPVIEPAIMAPGNKEPIDKEMQFAIAAGLGGFPEERLMHLKRAGMAARNASRRWFTANNGWPPNTPSTIKAKGSDRPLIDTGALKNAITYVVSED